MTSRSLFVFTASSLLAGAVAFAQQPANPQPQRRPIPAPTNLKVLPKDTTGPQVIAIMRNIEGQLGSGCSFCHAKDPATGRLNFASDANPMKDRGRVMMRMTQTINAEYLTQLTDPKPENPVTCGTCHRGMPQPSVFVPPPEEHHQAPQPAAPAPAPPAQ